MLLFHVQGHHRPVLFSIHILPILRINLTHARKIARSLRLYRDNILSTFYPTLLILNRTLILIGRIQQAIIGSTANDRLVYSRYSISLWMKNSAGRKCLPSGMENIYGARACPYFSFGGGNWKAEGQEWSWGSWVGSANPPPPARESAAVLWASPVGLRAEPRLPKGFLIFSALRMASPDTITLLTADYQWAIGG